MCQRTISEGLRSSEGLSASWRLGGITPFEQQALTVQLTLSGPPLNNLSTYSVKELNKVLREWQALLSQLQRYLDLREPYELSPYGETEKAGINGYQ